ncbi:MAG: NAD(P)(+) transhydrogenase (Re/Si-specific) subunit beta [Gammaproteobacteria bacterium]|nr:NAD(P)(+) transhydrogenase (Re/Si-specific) subunit beta [Gammaproteobacteria bacterium]NNE06832.1 NAD(P)(+) transhydrogenase (Re/Si-specific) subunit beta [Xanthomonadales bacterium]
MGDVLNADLAHWLIQASYFLAAILFISGLKKMSHPTTARGGVIWAGLGMLVATLITYLEPGMNNYMLMTVAIFVGGVLAWWSGKRVAMTDMPQMIALYNGMGGGSAAAIAAVELLRVLTGAGLTHEAVAARELAVLGALIGTIAFSGSLIAFAKLQGWMRKVYRFKGQQVFNGLVFVALIYLGVMLATSDFSLAQFTAFFVLALLFGVLMTVPIGGADMPVVISLYNALTGLAVGVEGFVLQNPAMMIAGIVVGSAGTLLTQLMAKAMNRPLSNVLFAGFGTGDDGGSSSEVSGSMKAIDAADAAITMAYAEKVVIVPGYGMAVAQAQHKIWELTQLLRSKGVKVLFAIHPVAGRMPGHMNVLLAEAGVPYDLIEDLEDINSQFPNTDVALVIGANDVVNPAARKDTSSPIYGMPILDADKARNVFVVKRGQGTGFSGIENLLFFEDNTRMCYGDAQEVAQKLIQGVKSL